jgi:UPF0755 protein
MKKKIILIIIVIIIIGSSVGYNFYSKIYNSNVTETTSIYIPTNAEFDDIQELIGPYLNNSESFVWVAEKKNYPNKIRAGKFKIKKGMSNDDLVNHLRGGKAETVKLTFNNQDSYEKLAGRIALQIESDSISILNAMKETEFLIQNDFTEQTGLAMYIPNSYDFYWNTSASKFRERMLGEYQNYWNEDRVKSAKSKNLTPVEVITLAAIVQKETSKVNERPKVAGLYLNRLDDHWPLQADPTIIYALKQKYGQDSTFRRVLNKDLRIDSPYNTYQNIGLPPGPIAMPDISSIEAVLYPQNHRYYYMCASVTDIGKHEFAMTLREHNKNARKYQKWINEQGIKR